MANFVLVHGAWHGGWCWVRVAERLRAAGHRVTTPTLTGLGERAHLLTRAVDLETHIRDIVAHLAWEELEDVVLVGHSYGGMAITGAADRAAERLRSLVYVDAYVPADGQAVLDLQLPERVPGVYALARDEGEGWWLPSRPAALYGIEDAADRTWVDRRVTRHPLAAFTQPVRLSGALERVPGRGYVLAGDYRPSAFHALYARFSADPRWRCWSLPTGHDIMVTMPAELAAILADMAA